MPAPKGNQNARRGKHPRVQVGLSGPTIDLIYESLALEGNGRPTNEEIRDAIYYAIRQVYGQRVQDQRAIIL